MCTSLTLMDNSTLLHQVIRTKSFSGAFPCFIRVLHKYTNTTTYYIPAIYGYMFTFFILYNIAYFSFE